MGDPHSSTATSKKLVSGKPDWLRVKAPITPAYRATQSLVESLQLHTVCQEAGCPNIGECWARRHAAVMILGDTCTRACRFCMVKTGKPLPVDPHEPERVARLAQALDLRHLVITSVDRDDLPDGGAEHFAHVIQAVKDLHPITTIEILTPDFLRKPCPVDVLAATSLDVFNHNLETVPRLYPSVRPGARYMNSLRLLQSVKERAPHIFTKSGLMVGLGESADELYQVMDDLRVADVDFLTLGQYLQPSPKHHPVKAYISPEEFEIYKKVAYTKGFSMVSSSPMTRSSYHADDDFQQLKAARENALQMQGQCA